MVGVHVRIGHATTMHRIHCRYMSLHESYCHWYSICILQEPEQIRTERINSYHNYVQVYAESQDSSQAPIFEIWESVHVGRGMNELK